MNLELRDYEKILNDKINSTVASSERGSV